MKVYRLVTRKTYERYMFDTASKKLGLDQAVLTKAFGKQGEETEDPSVMASAKQLSHSEIDSLLKVRN